MSGVVDIFAAELKKLKAAAAARCKTPKAESEPTVAVENVGEPEADGGEVVENVSEPEPEADGGEVIKKETEISKLGRPISK